MLSFKGNYNLIFHKKGFWNMYKQKLHSDFLECRIVKIPFLLLSFPHFVNPVSGSCKSSRPSLPPQTCTKSYFFKVNTCKRWSTHPLQEVISHGLNWAFTKKTPPGMCWYHTAGEWCSVTTLPGNDTMALDASSPSTTLPSHSRETSHKLCVPSRGKRTADVAHRVFKV